MDREGNLWVALQMQGCEHHQLIPRAPPVGRMRIGQRHTEKVTHASHRLGKTAFSPPSVFGTLTVFTDRHPLHCRCSSVAREDS